MASTARATVVRSPAEARLRLSTRQRAAALLGLYVIYVGAAVLGDTVVKINDVTPVWPASGVSIVGLYWLGPLAIPVVFVADLTANLIAGPTPFRLTVALGTASAVLLEPIVAVSILHRLAYDPSLRRWRDAAVLTLACVAGAAAGATLGVAVLAAAGAIDTLHGSFVGGAALAWRAWAPGDLVGDIALMSLFGVWRIAPNWRRRPLEWWFGIALLIFVAVIAFGARVEALYLLFPFLVWAPMRLGRHGAIITALIIGIVAVAETAHRVGPFGQADKIGGIVSLQIFLAVVLLTEIGFAVLRYERGAASAEVRHLAFYDALTSLPNRTMITDRIRQAAGLAARSGAPLAILLLDFDRFRLVNDGLGPEAGDDVLRQLVHRLSDGLRGGDTLGRFGGDQFVVVCDDCELREAVVIAERLLDLLVSTPVSIGNDEVSVSASIGIAERHGESAPEELLRNAGAAMALAKRAGGNMFEVYHAEARERVRTRLSLEAALRHAIDEDQLRLHFQPIVAMTDQTIGMFEALLRWQLPGKGLLAPGRFIALSEETGLILPIGEWVLREACAQVCTWPQSVSVTVNVSAVQVYRGDLASVVGSALADTGCDPRRVIVEITESALAHDVTPALSKVRDLGVRLALDDFGTGYASLGEIQRLPLDYIKIGWPFTRELASGSRATAIVDAVARMCHGLGMRSVAEGIETARQLGLVRNLGYDFVQGFHLMRPLDGDALRRVVDSASRARGGSGPIQIAAARSLLRRHGHRI